MGKLTKCSKASCCTDTNVEKSEDKLEVPAKKDMWYTAALDTDIYSLMNKERRNQYTMPFSELICYEPLPKCAEKVTELTLLLANSFVTGNKPYDYPEFNTIIGKTKKKWPNVGQLNMLSGMEAVENYIESLNYDATLKYCTDFIVQKVDNISSSLLYEVKWSQPTKEQPVDLATASMFFCLKMYYSMDNTAPVDVSYVYEYSHLVLRPGEVKFKDGWLIDVIQQKLEFNKEYDFKFKIDDDTVE